MLRHETDRTYYCTGEPIGIAMATSVHKINLSICRCHRSGPIFGPADRIPEYGPSGPNSLVVQNQLIGLNSLPGPYSLIINMYFQPCMHVTFGSKSKSCRSSTMYAVSIQSVNSTFGSKIKSHNDHRSPNIHMYAASVTTD